MLVTSHWPGFVQLLAAHERLWSPITQLETVLVLYNRDPSNGRNYPAWKILSISITKYFIWVLPDWSHFSYNCLNIWGFHSKPLIVSGWLYQSHVKKFVSLSLKDPLFMIRVMDSPRSVARDHPQSPASLWDPHRIIVTQRPRDSDRDIIVTCHVRFAWRHLWLCPCSCLDHCVCCL